MIILEQISLQIKAKECTEATKQARAAMFLSFTGYLARLSNNAITKAVIQKQGASRTFAHKREKTNATLFTQEQLAKFFKALRDLGDEKYFFAYIQLQGARRVSEVARLKIHDICFETNRMLFLPPKRIKPYLILLLSISAKISCLNLKILSERKGRTRSGSMRSQKTKNTMSPCLSVRQVVGTDERFICYRSEQVVYCYSIDTLCYDYNQSLC